MRVLIIEDERPAQLQLKKLLESLRPEAELLGMLDSVEASVRFLKAQPPPDLIFMDIQLADGLSFSIFSQVAVDAPVIFTTAYDQYALQAFKVNSIDYLLKPVEPEELAKALEKYSRVFSKPARVSPELVRQMLSAMREPNYRDRFLIRSGQQLTYIRTSAARYFYSDDGLTFARTDNGKRHTLDFSLDQLEEMLDPQRFFRLNRKVIAQVDSIHRISNYFNGRLILDLSPDPGFDVIVSRDRVQGFKEWLDR